MKEYNNTQGYELDWDSEIEQEGREFITLPEGVYPFRVTKFERGIYDGGAKIPKCKMATLSIALDGGELGEAFASERLYLHSAAEWKLSEFFSAIGLKKKGERVTMNWNAVPGATGLAEVYVDHYTNKNGQEMSNNKIRKFLPEDRAGEKQPAPAQGVAAPQDSGQQTALGGWQQRSRMADYQPGKF